MFDELYPEIPSFQIRASLSFSRQRNITFVFLIYLAIYRRSKSDASLHAIRENESQLTSHCYLINMSIINNAFQLKCICWTDAVYKICWMNF